MNRLLKMIFSSFRSKEDNEGESGIDGKDGEEIINTFSQEIAGTGMSEAFNDDNAIEDACDISIFNRVSDIRKGNENDYNGSNRSKENQEIVNDLNGKKELSKQIDEVSQVLERCIPIKVVLPPTKEENSRCKGTMLSINEQII